MPLFFITLHSERSVLNYVLIVILLVIMWTFILGLLLKGVGKLPKVIQGVFGLFGGMAGSLLLIILTILILITTLLM